MTEPDFGTAPRQGDAPSATFEELYQQAPCGYLSTTADDIIVMVNETLLRWTGYSRERLLGKNFAAFLDVGSQLFYETRYRTVLRLQGEVREVALGMVCADGSRLPILLNAVVSIDDEGRPAGVRAAVFDSTARQDYERELLTARRLAETSEARVRVLQDASSAFGACESDAELCETLAASARSAVDAADASVMLIDEAGQLRLAAGAHPIASADGGQDSWPASEVVSTGRTVTVSAGDGTTHHTGALDALRSVRFEALSAVPLLDGTSVIGVLSCFFGRPREFDAAFVELQEALARQAAQVLRRIRFQRQLERIALYDPLTGLANRNLLQERMAHALEEAIRGGRPMALIFLDLDGFKAINDDLGHSVGDDVLKQISARLRASVRESDLIGRFGGDEFVIICEDADTDAATLIAERVGAAVREPLDGPAATRAVTASIGVAVYFPAETPLISAQHMFRAADAAMYRSKDSGRDGLTLVRL